MGCIAPQCDWQPCEAPLSAITHVRLGGADEADAIDMLTQDLLPQMVALCSIHFCDGFGVGNMPRLMHALSAAPVQALALYNVSVADESAQELAAALTKLTALTALELQSASVSEAQMQALAPALRQMPCLRRLVLTDSGPLVVA